MPFKLYIYRGGGVWVQLLGVRKPILMLFLFYVNVSGMHLQSHLSSQPLTIATPWVLLCKRRPIPI